MPLKRKKALQAKTPLKRTGRPRAKARKASEFARVYGSAERVAWVASLPCVGCGHRGANHNHHTPHPSHGMGRKADAEAIVSLCAACHRMCHDIGEKRFAAMRGIDWAKAAARTAAAWVQINAG